MKNSWWRTPELNAKMVTMATARKTRSTPKREPVIVPAEPKRRAAAAAPRKRTAPAVREQVTVSAEEIRERAYFLSLQRNGGGDPLADWLRAERELAEGRL